MMRWLLLTACWITCLLARGADGEFRLLYAGNLTATGEGERGRLLARMSAQQSAGHADDVPTVVLLPGPIADPATRSADAVPPAFPFVAALSPQAVLLDAGNLPGSLAVLQASQARAPLPWLSANAAVAGFPTALFRVIPAGRLRIGVIGLQLAPGILPEQPLRTAFARQLALLRSRCDLLVLLGAFDALQAPVVAALYPEVDVILACTGERVPQPAGHAVCAPGPEAQPYYGLLEIAVRDGQLAAWRGWARTLDPEMRAPGD